jgi:amino acid transporter
MLVLLYRRITVLGKWTITFWLGVLAVMAWILVEGIIRFDRALAFQMPSDAQSIPITKGLGATMRLAMYCYLGYYAVCYIGDEVRDPGRTIPRAILLSALAVCLLFAGLHLAMLGTVPADSVPKEPAELEKYSLAADFMGRCHGPRSGAATHWAVSLVTILLIWSCVGATFAALLGYSRIPYGAARYGHFFSIMGRVHPTHHIPHISLLFVGALTLFWSFFDLQLVIDAFIVTRILEQFVGQVVGVMLLRHAQPNRARPFRIWLYPLPCGLALVGWLFMYVTAEPLFIGLSLMTLLLGIGVFFLWSWWTRRWPFGVEVIPRPA